MRIDIGPDPTVAIVAPLHLNRGTRRMAKRIIDALDATALAPPLQQVLVNVSQALRRRNRIYYRNRNFTDDETDAARELVRNVDLNYFLNHVPLPVDEFWEDNSGIFDEGIGSDDEVANEEIADDDGADDGFGTGDEGVDYEVADDQVANDQVADESEDESDGEYVAHKFDFYHAAKQLILIFNESRSPAVLRRIKIDTMRFVGWYNSAGAGMRAIIAAASAQMWLEVHQVSYTPAARNLILTSNINMRRRNRVYHDDDTDEELDTARDLIREGGGLLKIMQYFNPLPDRTLAELHHIRECDILRVAADMEIDNGQP